MTRPEWQDGEPVNLPAAAVDALEWLDWLRRARMGMRPEQRERLERCATALRAHLTTDEPETRGRTR